MTETEKYLRERLSIEKVYSATIDDITDVIATIMDDWHILMSDRLMSGLEASQRKSEHLKKELWINLHVKDNEEMAIKFKKWCVEDGNEMKEDYLADRTLTNEELFYIFIEQTS